MELKKFKGYYLPKAFEAFEDQILNMEVRDDDIWVCAFPKNGITWTQEIVWLLGNELNFEAAKAESQQRRFPFLELSMMPFDEKMITTIFKGKDSFTFTKELGGKRFIKTHLPWELLPRQIQSGEKKPKIIFVTRNPKDFIVSSYHHSNNMVIDKLSFEKHLDNSLNDKKMYFPYFNYLFGFINHIKTHNLFVMKYEDMKQDLSREINRLTEYLNVKSLTDEEMSKLEDHVSVESMRNNPSCNVEEIFSPLREQKKCDKDFTFIRQGKVGDYKTLITDEMEARIDKWIAENLEKRRAKAEDMPVYIKFKK